jgi:hypothetical protein
VPRVKRILLWLTGLAILVAGLVDPNGSMTTP